MKKQINIFLSLLLAAGLGSCSKEMPFSIDETATGSILKSAIMVELKNEDGAEQIFSRPGMTRAAVPGAEDFTVSFYKDGESEPYSSYLYSDMPEIVELPAGAVKAVATYGDNEAQGWESPYYKGESQFIVVADKVNDEIDPIVARLANVRVSIVFAPGLSAAMSADSKVTVVVGENGTLDFGKADVAKSGYFAYVENSRTLTATFRGQVEGYDVVESKGYDNVAPGNHYKITFKLHSADEAGEGDMEGNLSVDATVEVVDMNLNVDFDDDPVVDDMRPVEGDDPNGPDDPGPQPPVNNAPTIVAAQPDAEHAGYVPVDLAIRNEVTDNLYCVLDVTSTADGGIQEFKVVINSVQLSPEELASVGLAQVLDLVNPDKCKKSPDSDEFIDCEAPLTGLGFPVHVGGKKNVSFSITSFLPLLGALGAGEHDFVLTVTDANGTTETTLKLKTL